MSASRDRWENLPDSSGNIRIDNNNLGGNNVGVDSNQPQVQSQVQGAGIFLPQSASGNGGGNFEPSNGYNDGTLDNNYETNGYSAGLGRFLGSRPDQTKENSDYLECIYTPLRPQEDNVLILCEKNAGCCTDGCCPVDPQWMAGVYVLIAFVIIVAVVGFAAAIVCYQRSKSKARKEAYNDGYAASQMGSHMGYPYGSSYGPPSAKY